MSMITITATFEIDESRYYFEGKTVRDWFTQKIASGDLAASIHYKEVDKRRIEITKNYNGVPITVRKHISDIDSLAETTKLKVQ
jgi:hypothetical protein